MSASGRSADIAATCGKTLAVSSPPLCPPRHPLQSVAVCPSIAAGGLRCGIMAALMLPAIF